MGYYTCYTLKIIKGSEDLIEEFRNQFDSARYIKKKIGYAIDKFGNTNQECKWYSSNEELIKFSLNHPDVLFKLSGEGEESGDIWDLYVQNGKSQLCVAEIVLEPFDPEKLK